MKRREVFKNIVLGSAAIPLIDAFPAAHESIPDNLCILFQGDSITDAGRDRGRYYANDPRGMGQGYVRHTVTELMGLHPEKSTLFYNRGISGHKVFQLAERWNEDCLMLNPDVLSILIGVNDFWHTLSHSYQGTVKTFEGDLKALLDTTLKRLPSVKLLLGEPFVLLEGTAIDAPLWKRDFPAYQDAVREIAHEYNTAFIPYQKIFNKALELRNTAYWCPDGVHPSMAGNYLMANGWLQAFYSLYE